MYPFHFFERAARRWPDAIAAEAGDQKIGYADLLMRANALACGLQKIDPEPGSRVGICCYNSLEHLTAWLATLAAGKVWVPLQATNTADELCRAAGFVGASIIVTDGETVPRMQGARGSGVTFLSTEPTDHDRIITELIAEYEGAIPAPVALPLDAPQAIKFTGGTTGTPKGVMQPYRAWNTNIVTQIDAWSLAPGERCLAAAPITHGTSTYILPTLGSGGTLVLLDRPRPEQTLAALQTGDITTTFVPPTVLYVLMELEGVRDSDYASLRNFIYGGGPMRPEAITRAQDIFGPCIASTYGQTEAPQIATMITAEDLLRPEKRASVGRETMLSEVAILDPEGARLAAGETGEVVIRGDLVMTGYWNQPEKTAETIRNGWLHTGDLGMVDKDGFLFIKGRAKDMIITGGYNVYPADVEPMIGEHPAVLDCAVFGIADDKWGESVHAAVQLSEAATADAILAFAREKLGPVKTPKTITIYDRLPRNALGKLQKSVLVEDYEARKREEAS